MTDPDLDAALASYRVPKARPELVDDVMARIARTATPRSRLGYFAGAAAVAVVAVVALLVSRDRPPSHGAYASSGRASLSIGDRGTAVAEDGADVSWAVAPDGSAHVEQRAGDVFYRVEHGAPFSVETPAGTVIVRGTCFRVEVQPMPITRQHLVSAALGAAVAASVLVVVYEGGVRVVNARGSVDLKAGEHGRIDPNGAPSRDGVIARSGDVTKLGSDASRAELLAQATAAQDQLAIANATITDLKKQIAEARADGSMQPSNVDPTPQQLADWAKICHIHIDAPSVFGATASKIDASFATEWGLTKTEVPVMDKALADMQGKAREEMRDIYLAATNNIAGADELTASAMLTEIFEKASPADKLHARQRLSRERAGLQQPPASIADMTPFERALRLVMRLGNDLEHTLADSLGGVRSHDLRTKFNSWPGWQLSEDGCDEQTR